MKVLSPGRKDPKWKTTTSCKPCGASLEVSRSDLWRKDDIFVGGGIGLPTFHVKCFCGACGVDTTIDGHTGKYKWGHLPTQEEFLAARAQQEDATPA